MTTTSYYAQTFPKDPQTKKPVASPLYTLFTDSMLQPNDSIVVYLSSFHFGVDADHTPYLHFNDDNVLQLDDFFQDVKKQCSIAICQVEIRIMLGGAGGAYQALFSQYDTYYALLKTFLKRYPYIRGIDLDVEECLSYDKQLALTNIQKVIRQLHQDFVVVCDDACEQEYDTIVPFSITMAPVAYALTDKTSLGMGGFSYYDLYHSTEGKYISHFNVQAYGCYDFETFQSIIQTGYAPDKIVYGMLGDAFAEASLFAHAMSQLQIIHVRYPSFKGAILWEYGDTHIDGIAWGQSVRRALFDHDNEQQFIQDKYESSCCVS